MRWPPRAARVGSLKAAVIRLKAARGRGWVLEERGLPELAGGEVQRPAPGAARQPAGHGEESPAQAAGGAEVRWGSPSTLVQRSRLWASAAMTVHAGLAKKRPLALALRGAAAADDEPAAAERGLGDLGDARGRAGERGRPRGSSICSIAARTWDCRRMPIENCQPPACAAPGRSPSRTVSSSRRSIPRRSAASRRRYPASAT